MDNLQTTMIQSFSDGGTEEKMMIRLLFFASLLSVSQIFGMDNIPKNMRNQFSKGLSAEQELIKATESGNLKNVQKALLQLSVCGGNVNALTLQTRQTSLHIAAINGNVDILKALITNGAWLDVGDQISWSPLHWAAMTGHAEIVKELLRRGAHINITDSDGIVTPLHLASMQGHIKTVIELLDQGARYFVRDLHIAVDNGHVDVVKEMLSRGANVHERDASEMTALHHAAEHGHVEVVKALLDGGANVNEVTSNGVTPLICATACRIDRGQGEVVKELLNRGASCRGWDLSNAAFSGHIEMVKALLDRGADLHQRDQHQSTILHAAVGHRHPEVVKELLERGADPNALNNLNNDKFTPLRPALRIAYHERSAHDKNAGNVEEVRILLEYGGDPREYAGVGEEFKCMCQEILFEGERRMLFGTIEDVRRLFFPTTWGSASNLLMWRWANLEQKQRAFLLAVGQGRVDIVRLFLENNIFSIRAITTVTIIINRLKRLRAAREKIASYQAIQELLHKPFVQLLRNERGLYLNLLPPELTREIVRYMTRIG